MLVIDDSELAQSAMLRLLEDAGFEVHVQATAVGALANIKRLGIEVAIVDTLASVMTRTMAHGSIRKDGNARSFAQQLNGLLRDGN